MRMGCAVMHDLNNYENEQSRLGAEADWESENAPVVQLDNGSYLDTHKHRFVSQKDGEWAVRMQDRARDEFLNPDDYNFDDDREER